MDLKEKPRPHFLEIARELIEAISSGRYPVGTYLPKELELRDRYQTSRHTVRAALHELQQLGLVSRRKNVGTRVESTQPTNDFRVSLASVEDLVQFGATHLRAVQAIQKITATETLARELGCRSGAAWLRISSLRLDGNPKSPPIGWTDVYVDPSYEELAETVRASPDTLISSLIESRYGRRIAEIRQEISAINATEPMAKALRTAIDAPLLKIVRRYLDAADQLFEVSISVHPPDRFSVSMRMRRSQG